MERVCPYCGSAASRYNAARGVTQCAVCGHELPDAARDARLREADQTYRLAMEHLRVGNWQRCVDLLTPLCGQYPTEPKYYRGIIRAASHDLSDVSFVTKNVPEKILLDRADDAWDHLKRLHALDSELRAYAKRCKKAQTARFEKVRRETVGTLALAAAAGVVIHFLFKGTGNTGLGEFIFGGALVCGVYACVMAKRYADAFRKLNGRGHDASPFYVLELPKMGNKR